MKLKLIKDLLRDIVEMFRPLIFSIAISAPIVFFNEYGLYGTEEVMKGPIALMHTLKAVAIGISIDVVWVSIWLRIKKD